MTLPSALAAQLELGEFVVRKGNLIEVLAPDPSVDLQDLIDDIGDAMATNPYLILLGPGTYELPTSDPLTLKPFVHLAGSGQATTTILGDGTSGGSDCGNLGLGVVAVTDNTTLRDLTVTLNTDSGSNGRVVCNLPDTSPVIRRVTVQSIAGVTGGKRYGFYLAGGVAELFDVTVVMDEGEDNFGLYCREDTEISVDGAELTLTNPMDDNRAIWLVGTCLMEIRNVVAVVDGGAASRGAHVQTGTRLDMQQGRFTVGGPGANIGLKVEGTGIGLVHDMRLNVTGGSSAVGVDLIGDSVLKVYRSSVRGTTNAISTSSTVEGLVSQSTLLGGVTGTGDLACVASDDGTGAALTATCT